MKRSKGWVLAAALTLAACGNPHTTVLPTDITKLSPGELDSLTNQVKKLTRAEQALLGSYERRHLGDPIPLGTTVDAAIADQKNFEAAAAKKEVEDSALRAAALKQQADAIAAVDQAVMVVLTNKMFSPHNYQAGQMQDTVDIVLAVANKGTKTIAGIKGVGQFKDMFGDPIKTLNVSMTKEIQPKGMAVWDGSMEYNPFTSSDVALRNAETSKIKFTFVPTTIVYTDGTKLEVPQASPDLPIPPPPQ